jgi:hypothetical protein
MQVTSQSPDPVEVLEHGVAKARHIRPQIGGAKGRPGKQFRIVGGKFETDVEGLFNVSRLAGIERLTAEPDITTVAAGAAERGCLPDRSRSAKESCGALENARHQCRRNSVAGNIEEPYIPACPAQRACDGVRIFRRASQKRADVNDGNRAHMPVLGWS